MLEIDPKKSRKYCPHNSRQNKKSGKLYCNLLISFVIFKFENLMCYQWLYSLIMGATQTRSVRIRRLESGNVNLNWHCFNILQHFVACFI